MLLGAEHENAQAQVGGCEHLNEKALSARGPFAKDEIHLETTRRQKREQTICDDAPNNLCDAYHCKGSVSNGNKSNSHPRMNRKGLIDPMRNSDSAMQGLKILP